MSAALDKLKRDALRTPEEWAQIWPAAAVHADWIAAVTKFGAPFVQLATTAAAADGLATWCSAQPSPNDAACRWYLERLKIAAAEPTNNQK